MSTLPLDSPCRHVADNIGNEEVIVPAPAMLLEPNREPRAFHFVVEENLQHLVIVAIGSA